MTTFLTLPVELLQHISLALACPSQPTPNGNLLASTKLRDLAALATTSRLCHAIANPLLHTAAIALDLVSSQLIHRQEAFLRRSPLRLLCAVEAYKDPWLSVSASGQPSYDYEPLLLWAVTSGRLDLLKRLLQHVPASLVSFLLGARLAVRWPCLGQQQPHSQPRPGPASKTAAYFATPLHAAARTGQDKLIEYILNRCGGNVDIDAEAQLLCLCPSPQRPTLHPPVHVPDELCATPLHMALSHGKHSAAKLLILRGAIWDRSFNFSEGLTGLHIMAATGAVDLVNWIVDSHDPVVMKNGPLHDWPDVDGFYSLHYACLSPGAADETGSNQPLGTDDSPLVSSLARLGAVVNTKDEKEAAQRFSTESQRLGDLVEHWWRARNGRVSDWAYRFKYWERDMKDFEFAPEEPAVFAAGLGLHSMAQTIRRLHNEPEARTL